jgi:GMP synthase-like glutamine amidotransferase
MSTKERGLDRRDFFRSGGTLAAGAAGLSLPPGEARAAKAAGSAAEHHAGATVLPYGRKGVAQAKALREGVPTIGHCLGGQLMARALGATVGPSPASEIGWQPIDVLDTPAARLWLGAPGAMHVFQWHHEAFSLPPGAEVLATSAACPHQAFALGPHLAMQFHIEIDAAKIELWTRHASAHDLALLGRSATTQTASRMRDEAQWRLAQHQHLAARIYARWLSGMR